jgi:hypothetical protein
MQMVKISVNKWNPLRKTWHGDPRDMAGIHEFQEHKLWKIRQSLQDLIGLCPVWGVCWSTTTGQTGRKPHTCCWSCKSTHLMLFIVSLQKEDMKISFRHPKVTMETLWHSVPSQKPWPRWRVSPCKNSSSWHTLPLMAAVHHPWGGNLCIQYVDRITDQVVKFSFLMGGKWVLDEVLRQALRLHALKVADRPPSRLCVLRNALPMEKLLLGIECSRIGWPVFWQYGGVGHLRRDFWQGCPRRTALVEIRWSPRDEYGMAPKKHWHHHSHLTTHLTWQQRIATVA